jgi:hypothetical protein
MTEVVHSHVPFPLILIHHLLKWKDTVSFILISSCYLEQHGGKAPSNSQEKDEFKKIITNGKIDAFSL